jgi:hypothetical protein
MVGTSVLNRFLASMDPIPARPAPWALPMNTETYPRPARLGGDGGCLYPWWLEYINTYTYIYILIILNPKQIEHLPLFLWLRLTTFRYFWAVNYLIFSSAQVFFSENITDPPDWEVRAMATIFSRTTRERDSGGFKHHLSNGGRIVSNGHHIDSDWTEVRVLIIKNHRIGWDNFNRKAHQIWW